VKLLRSLHAVSVQCTLYTTDTSCDAVVRTVLQHVTPCTLVLTFCTNLLPPSSGWKIEQTDS
jgi:hypothetical protein